MSRFFSTSRFALVLATAFVGNTLLVPSSQASDWTNAAGGSFQDQNNWNPVAVPTASDPLVFSLAGPYTVTFADNGAGASDTISAGNVSYSLSGFTLSIGGMTQVSAAASLTLSGGTLSTGSLDVSNASGFTFSSGTIVINGGQLAPKLVSVDFYSATNTPTPSANSFAISSSSNATTSALSLINGGSFSSAASRLLVGNSGNRGLLNIDASSATLTVGEVVVGIGRTPATGGAAGEGTLSLTNSARLTAPTLYLGRNGGRGTATVDNSTISLSSTLSVGIGTFSGTSNVAAEGSLTIGSGGRVSAGTVNIASSGAKGYVHVNGGTFNATGTLTVGQNAGSTGTVDLSSGTLLSSATNIGIFTAAGTVTVAGSNSNWSNTGDIAIGNFGLTGGAAGSGTVSLSNNATLTNTNTLKVWSAGGHLSLDSGATLATGTLDINANVLSSNFTWTGGTLKINKGTAAADAAIALNVPNTGTLGGIGSITRPVTVASGGTLAPGNSAGSITLSSLTLSTGSNYFVEFDAADFDKTNVTTLPPNLSGVPDGLGGTVGGANLVFTFINGATPALTSPYVIIDNQTASPVVGVFDGLVEGNTYHRGEVAFSVDYHAGTGSNDVAITFSAVPEPTAGALVVASSALMLMRRRRRLA
jgi:fibronectin-binding autotransporter adhesin